MEIKEEFITWMNNKGSYSGVNFATDIERYLNFLNFNPFEVKGDFSDIDEIKIQLVNADKELKKNDNDFIKLNLKSGNGRPSAIMGTENYFKFLDELKSSTKINNFTPYFNLEGVKDYQKVSDTKYNSSTKEAKWYYDTRMKLYFLIQLLSEKLNQNFEIVYTEQPNAQKGRGKINFKDYILAGFALKPNFNDDIFIKVSFSNLKNNPHFVLDIDINFRKGTSRYKDRRQEIYSSNLIEWELNEEFPKNWDDLVNLISPEILKLSKKFKEYISEFNPENTLKKIMKIKNIPLNQILYGPPGTGKTYNTIDKALKIINEGEEQQLNWEERKAIKNLFDKRIAEGRIVFSTFHQSMCYEDFIEGIKPKTVSNQVQYEIEDGIFKSLVKKALVEYIRKDSGNKETSDFDILYNDFTKSIKPLEGKRQGAFKTKTGIEIMLVEANDNSILVKYLWSDNSKKETEGQHVFSVTKEKLKKVLLEGIDPSKIKSLKADLHPLIGHIHCELFAVYKNFYDFVIANKGEIETIHFDEDELSFEDVKEQFDLLNKEDINAKIVKSFVIIIDEINRGNVSSIFGELITLIEEDKRLGKDEALEVILPYSKEKFGIPPNLYIIGTMNTADRSVEALDTALRRRFCFEEMPPLYNLEELQNNIFGYKASDILKTINSRIEKLLDKDHKIGHSYLLNKDENSIIDSFYKNIIPLLQEYFFGDYSKIGLVLGTDFVSLKESDSDIFAKFYDVIDDFDNRNIYEIIDYRKNKLDQEINFGKAIKVLMNK